MRECCIVVLSLVAYNMLLLGMNPERWYAAVTNNLHGKHCSKRFSGRYTVIQTNLVYLSGHRKPSADQVCSAATYTNHTTGLRWCR